MNLLYVKLKNVKKHDLLLIEYLISEKKVAWFLTEEQLKEMEKKK